MASADYKRRLEAVLAAKVDEIEVQNMRKRQRQHPMRIAGVLAVTVTFFFVLKAFAFTQSDTALSQPLAAEAGIGATILFWFAGADPITQALATAMQARSQPASL